MIKGAIAQTKKKTTKQNKTKNKQTNKKGKLTCQTIPLENPDIKKQNLTKTKLLWRNKFFSA